MPSKRFNFYAKTYIISYTIIEIVHLGIVYLVYMITFIITSLFIKFITIIRLFSFKSPRNFKYLKVSL